MEEKNKKNSFILQAGILAAAGILCRIIGILYRSPLTNIIGDEGNGYYSSAYNIYAIILLVSSYSIPSAISKVISQRLALKEYRNAHRIFHCALIYVVIVGGIASLFTFFGAGLLVEEHSIPVLQIFAPTIFISGLLGVFRGYFQSHRTMVQTSISQILEQIANAVISIFAAYLLMASVNQSDATDQAIHGAMGSAMGTGFGVLIALIFMVSVYALNRKIVMRRIQSDNGNRILPYGKIFKIIIFMVTPVILSTFIYNFSTSLNQTIYTKFAKNLSGYSSAEIATAYGIFAGKAVVISNIPIAIASAISAAMIPNISGTYAKGDIRATNRLIHRAIKTTMMIAIPSAIGLYALAKPVVTLLFPQPESIDLATKLLQGLCITVVFYSLSTLTNAILQSVGKVNKPVINAAVALVIQTVVLVILILTTDLDLFCLVIATVVYSFLMCVFNQRSVHKVLGYRNDFMKSYVMPLVISTIMGIIAFVVYKGAYYVIKSNLISLVIAIVIAIIFYLLGTVKLGVVTEKELSSMPKGSFLVKILKKVRLLSNSNI